ncbi:Tensin-3, partial [Schistosoma japonicum]
NINSKIENIYKLKSAFTSPSENLLNNQHNPEDRSRLHDSLENLTEPIQSRHLPLQLAPCLNKKNHFRYLCPNTKLDSSVKPCKLSHVNDNKINELNIAIDNDEKVKSHYDPWLSTSINKRITSGAYSYLDAGLESVQEEFDNVNNHDDDYAGDHPVDNEMKHSTNNNSQSETDSLESDNYDPNSRRQQNHHESSSSSSSLSFKKLHPKYLFQSKKPKHKSPEDVNNNQEERKSGKDFNEQGCMPPPSSTTVLKKYSKKHKSIGTRIVNFFSAHSKHRKLDSDQSINNSSIHSSDSSNNNNINVDYDDSSELSLGQQSSEGNSNNKSISRKTHASCRGIPTEKLGPPCKTRKVLSVGTSPTHSIGEYIYNNADNVYVIHSLYTTV